MIARTKGGTKANVGTDWAASITGEKISHAILDDGRKKVKFRGKAKTAFMAGRPRHTKAKESKVNIVGHV